MNVMLTGRCGRCHDGGRCDSNDDPLRDADGPCDGCSRYRKVRNRSVLRQADLLSESLRFYISQSQGSEHESGETHLVCRKRRSDGDASFSLLAYREKEWRQLVNLYPYMLSWVEHSPTLSSSHS